MSRLIWTIIAIAALLAVCLALFLRSPQDSKPGGSQALAKRSGYSPTPTPTPTLLPFRLAGIAQGGESFYAVVEDPQGVTALYRLGDAVSGLGEVVEIREQEIRIRAESGIIAMRLQPAPTTTPSLGTLVPTVTPLPLRSAPSRAGIRSKSPP